MKIRAWTKDLEVQDLDEETLIYNPWDGGSCHVLNRTSAALWRLCDCDEGRSKEELTVMFAESTGLPADREIVEMALFDLKRSGLVFEHGIPDGLPSPLPQHGVERRQLIKRLGLAASSIALLPVVDSVLAPLGLGLGEAHAAGGMLTTRGYCIIPTEPTTTMATTPRPEVTTMATTPRPTTMATTPRPEVTTMATTPRP